MKNSKSLEDELFLAGLIFIVAGGVFAALYLGGLKKYLPAIPCFFSNILGFYCPGCGGTRAVMALLKGQLLKSLWYHPLVPYSVVVGGGFMLTQGLHRIGIPFVKGWKYHNWFHWGFVLLFVCNFLIKNALRLVWGITM